LAEYAQNNGSIDLLAEEIMARQTIIVQFKAESDDSDMSWFFDFHEILDVALKISRSGKVDGNDFGSGTINMYVLTDSARRAFEIILTHLKNHKLESEAVVAKRRSEDRYVILWPAGYTDKFSEM
jgi:hypothetical protein